MSWVHQNYSRHQLTFYLATQCQQLHQHLQHCFYCSQASSLLQTDDCNYDVLHHKHSTKYKAEKNEGVLYRTNLLAWAMDYWAECIQEFTPFLQWQAISYKGGICKFMTESSLSTTWSFPPSVVHCVPLHVPTTRLKHVIPTSTKQHYLGREWVDNWMCCNLPV